MLVLQEGQLGSYKRIAWLAFEFLAQEFIPLLWPDGLKAVGMRIVTVVMLVKQMAKQMIRKIYI